MLIRSASSEANNKPHGKAPRLRLHKTLTLTSIAPLHLRLAQRHYSARLVHLRDLIAAEEARFKQVVLSIRLHSHSFTPLHQTRRRRNRRDTQWRLG